MRYCVSIGEKSWVKVVEALKKINFAEIRLDKINNLNSTAIENIFSTNKELIATFRSETKDKLDYLKKAIVSGADYVDLDIDTLKKYKSKIYDYAKKNNCKLIVSYHNFYKTPSFKELTKIVHKALGENADIVKICCMVKSNSDNIRLLRLLSKSKKVQPIGMGKKGIITRIIAPFLGSPYTFVSLEPGKETAEGQVDIKTYKKIIDVLKNVL